VIIGLAPGVNPTITSFNDSVGKKFPRKNSIARFKNKDYFPPFYVKTLKAYTTLAL
jgi:hypothetical protein